MDIKNLLTQISITKKEIKAMNNELKEDLLNNAEYAEFYEDKKESAEVLRSYRAKLIKESTFLSSLIAKINVKKNEIKLAQGLLNDRLIITDKESGESVQLSLF